MGKHSDVQPDRGSTTMAWRLDKSQGSERQRWTSALLVAMGAMALPCLTASRRGNRASVGPWTYVPCTVAMCRVCKIQLCHMCTVCVTHGTNGGWCSDIQPGIAISLE